MEAIIILFSLIASFVGYIIGRTSHMFWGYLKTPHHWIYGLFLIIIGIIFWHNLFGILILFFGIGLFISDFKDFLDLKFYGADEDGLKRFWGIN